MGYIPFDSPPPLVRTHGARHQWQQGNLVTEIQSLRFQALIMIDSFSLKNNYKWCLKGLLFDSSMSTKGIFTIKGSNQEGHNITSMVFLPNMPHLIPFLGDIRQANLRDILLPIGITGWDLGSSHRHI